MSFNVIQSPTVVGESDITNSSIATLSDGDYVITYGSLAPPNGVIGQIFDDSGVPVGAATFLSSTFGDFIDFTTAAISIAALSGGGFVLAWDGNAFPPGENIGTQIFNDDGSIVPLSYDSLTNNPDNTNPEVTSLTGGGYALTWTSSNGTGSLVTATFNAQGQELTLPLQLTANGENNPAQAASAGGGYAVAWAELGNSANPILFASFDGNGAEIGSPVNITQGISNQSFFLPQMATLTNANYAIAWEGDDIISNAGTIWTAVYDGNGQQVVAAEMVAPGIGTPAVTALAGGHYALAWTGVSGGVFTQVLDAHGQAVSTALDVGPANSSASPYEVTLSNGDYALLWYNGVGGGVMTAVCNPQGQEVAGPVLVDDDPSAGLSGYTPQMTALANGEYAITWESTDPQTGNFVIHSAVYQFTDSSGAVSDITYINDTSVTVIDLPGVTSVGGSVTITGDTSVTEVNLNDLITVGGNVTITGDTSVTEINAGDLTSVGGSVTITGDTSVTSIDIVSLDTTGGDVTIDSGADATLDASALGPGGGTVKLIGDNLTTTITLGALAHMGGTLTISSADGVTLTSHAGLAEFDITGTSAGDTLTGSATAKNVIDGQGGNDSMTGGASDDGYLFDFSVSQHTEDVTQTVHHHDLVDISKITSVTIAGKTYFEPSLTASINAWKNWNTELTTWANAQPDNTGGDVFTSLTLTGTKSDSKPIGTIQLIDGYYHNYDTTQAVPTLVTDLSGEGSDTITNFANQALTVTNGGGGNDSLLVNGLSSDSTALNYWGNWLSSTTANGNTVIHFHDVAHAGADAASITLLGVSTTAATLVADHIISFGAAVS